MAIDTQFEEDWKKVLAAFENKFGEDLDIQALLFLIGVQELGQGPKKYTKDQKVELIHIAICTLLTPFGYYELEAEDEDGWPHYKTLKSLPSLTSGEQLKLMKQAIIEYHEQHQHLFA